MNLTEILKAKSISDELIQAILEDMKANGVYTASEENLDIRYGKLKTQHEGTEKQLAEATALIETLKKSTKGQEDAQQKITAYEQQVQQLAQELEQTKLDAAIKVELLAAHAMDVDYLTFKLKEKKEKGELTLDEQGKIKGWDDKLAGLRTQFPTQFEAQGKKNVIENRLPTGVEPGEKLVTQEEFNRMGYGQKVQLRQENPDLYDQLTKG